MERKVIQFQILSAKGKLWKYNDGFGNYSFGYWENMIVFLFSDGTFQCEPVFDLNDLEPLDKSEGFFIEYLHRYDFDLQDIQNADECSLDEAKKLLLGLIKMSGIKCSDEVLEMLK